MTALGRNKMRYTGEVSIAYMAEKHNKNNKKRCAFLHTVFKIERLNITLIRTIQHVLFRPLCLELIYKRTQLSSMCGPFLLNQ